MTEQPTTVMPYWPEVFDVADQQQSKEIILDGEGPGAETNTRWQRETPYVLELVRQAFPLGPDTVVLDYGCGIGRMAKAMIEAAACSVIGVDISPSMRLAVDYVGSDRFLAVSPAQYDIVLGAGLRVTAAIAVWVLQHCFAPADDIARIRRGLVADGPLFVLNMPKRAVPAAMDKPTPKQRVVWASDGVDIADLLRSAFRLLAEGVPDPSRTPNMADAGAFWMVLRAAGG